MQLFGSLNPEVLYIIPVERGVVLGEGERSERGFPFGVQACMLKRSELPSRRKFTKRTLRLKTAQKPHIVWSLGLKALINV